MRIGIVCARRFGDMEQVRWRLARGAQAPCTLVVRARDHFVLGLLAEIEAENVEIFEPQWEPSDAKANEFLNSVDHMLVFHVPNSTTEFYVRKAREYPYNLIFGPKTSIVECVRERRTVPKRSRRLAGASDAW